jgi:hypothetical protein
MLIEILLCLFALTVIVFGIFVGNLWQVIAGNFMLLLILSLNIKNIKEKQKENDKTTD